MATQAADTKAHTGVDAIISTLIRSVRDAMGPPSYITDREIVGTSPHGTWRVGYYRNSNTPGGFSIYVNSPSSPVVRPSPEFLGGLVDAREAQRSASAATLQNRSPVLKAYVEELAVRSLIAAGDRACISEVSKEEGLNFMTSVGGDLCGSYLSARKLIPSLVEEFYERLLRSTTSTPHSMASVLTNRSEIIGTAKKFFKAWTKMFWGVQRCRRDGAILIAINEDRSESLILQVKNMSEDSEDEEVQDDAFQKKVMAIDSKLRATNFEQDSEGFPFMVNYP